MRPFGVLTREPRLLSSSLPARHGSALLAPVTLGCRIERGGFKWPPHYSQRLMATQAQGTADITQPDDGIITRELHEEATSSYLSYAMSIMVGRALPDARDGLKPVHRRVLHAIQDLGLVPSKPFKKCARVVGEVLGKYHPHGDQAVYDSLVRMSQSFAMGEPLVNGHGNFGSIDNDPAAAMRYTECRLQAFAQDAMLKDLDPSVVAYQPNFDESVQEPSVLPARIPQLLLNGSQGIAVGIATKIPPHNLIEIVKGMKAVIDDPDVSIDELLKLIPGPDFPTGGQLLSGPGTRSAYANGKGSITLRATIHVENIKRSSKGSEREVIVVTELPYQVYKAALITDIAAAIEKGTLVGISDIRDESDRTGMRIAIEVKRGSSSAVVLNNLLMHSRLQIRFSANMVALVGGAPAVLPLKNFLQVFIDFRLDVLTKRAQAQLSTCQARHHIVQGFLKAVEHLDDVVKCIRTANDVAEARASLQQKYALSDEQVEAVLNMSLRRLTSLAIVSLVTEEATLSKEMSDLSALLEDKAALLQIMKDEADAIVAKYGRPRRTSIAAQDVAEKMTSKELVVDEKGLLIVTGNGYIKRVQDSSFTTQKRGGRGKSAGKTRVDDTITQVLTVMSHDDLVCITTSGHVYKIPAFDVPECARTAQGSPLAELIPKMKGTSIAAFLPLRTYSSSDSLLMISKAGIAKRLALSELQNIRQGMRVMGCKEKDEVCFAQTCKEGDAIFVVSSLGKAILFDAASVRELSKAAQGVKCIKLGKGHVVGVSMASKAEVNASTKSDGPWMMLASDTGLGKRVPLCDFTMQGRGGSGVIAMKLTPGSCLASVNVVHGSGPKAVNECLLNTSAGNVSRIRLEDFKVYGRIAKGVKVIKLQGPDDTLLSATPCQYVNQSETESSDDAE